MTFDNAGNYFVDPSQELTLWVTTNSSATAVDDTWTQVTIDKYSSGSFTFTKSTVDLGNYCGSKIKIAFGYYSTEDMCGTWELRNLEIK